MEEGEVELKEAEVEEGEVEEELEREVEEEGQVEDLEGDVGKELEGEVEGGEVVEEDLEKKKVCLFVCLLVGCLTSQQQASVSQGRIYRSCRSNVLPHPVTVY